MKVTSTIFGTAKRMSARNNHKDSSGILFDTRTKAVMTTLAHGNQELIKEKISAVREIIPARSNHEITLVLQYYEYNVNEAIAAFIQDGASDALKAWNHTGTKPAKKKNKKKNTNKPPPGASVANPNPDEPSKNNTSYGLGYIEEGLQKTFQNGTMYDPLSSEVPDDKSDDNSSVKTENSEMQQTLINHPNLKSSSTKFTSGSSSNNSRQNSLSKSEDLLLSKNSRGKKSLEKSIKELGRHNLSFQRTGNLLNEEIEKSQKRLQQSFRELHQALDQREKELAKALTNVKHQATDLLHMRQDQAAKLKIGIDRGDGKSDTELNELRIDIKHFVSERKFDDELCRTVRFVRDHDRLLQEIKLYGEVVPVKNNYTQRRQSVSSNASSPAQSEASNNVRASAAPVVNSYTVPGSSITISSTTMNSSELAELQRKLQESLRLQGLPSNPTACIVSGQGHSTIVPSLPPVNPEENVQINGSTPNTRPQGSRGRRKASGEGRASETNANPRQSNQKNYSRRGNGQIQRGSNNQPPI